MDSGHINITRRYKITKKWKSKGNQLEVAFSHDMDIQDWESHEMPGISFSWYCEDKNGQHVKISKEPLHKQDNEKYIKWMNIFKYAISKKNMTTVELWGFVNQIRISWTLHTDLP